MKSSFACLAASISPEILTCRNRSSLVSDIDGFQIFPVLALLGGGTKENKNRRIAVFESVHKINFIANLIVNNIIENLKNKINMFI